MECNHNPVLPRGSYLWPLRQQASRTPCKCRKCGKSVVMRNYSQTRWIWFFTCLAVYVLYCIIVYFYEYTTRSTYAPLGHYTPLFVFGVPILLLGVISRIAERIILPRLKWIEYQPMIASADNDTQREMLGQQLMGEYNNNSNRPQI